MGNPRVAGVGPDPRLRLLALTEVLGESFGTEDFAQFLYALVRMQKPETIVELGTGFGVSALWMALGAKLNGRGHVFAVDDLDLLNTDPELLRIVLDGLERGGFGAVSAAHAREYFDAVITELGLGEQLTIVERHMDLQELDHFTDYPFATGSIDLLFSDFRHGPSDVLAVLDHFLPRMAPRSSIFIDSVPTSLASALLLEEVVEILNTGRAPAMLGTRWSAEAMAAVCRRRFRLVHVREQKDRPQNATSWLAIEPLGDYRAFR